MKNKILWLLLCVLMALRITVECLISAGERFAQSILFELTIILALLGAIVWGAYHVHLRSVEQAIEAHNPCPKKNWDFIVVDSIGRRYRPVPCAKESQYCDECGEFDDYEEEWVYDDDLPVTLMYENGKRKKTYFTKTGDCGYGCLVRVKLERIQHYN